MTYRCIYKTNSLFPYSNKVHKLKKGQPLKNSHKDNFYDKSNNNSFGILSNFLAPIEKIIGKKISFDDVILILLIYLLYTEKNNENNTLLFCLIFILLG